MKRFIVELAKTIVNYINSVLWFLKIDRIYFIHHDYEQTYYVLCDYKIGKILRWDARK